MTATASPAHDDLRAQRRARAYRLNEVRSELRARLEIIDSLIKDYARRQAEEVALEDEIEDYDEFIRTARG